MRINIPWTGAVLFFLAAGFAFPAIHPTSPVILISTISPHPETAVTAAHDDTKNSWSRLNSSATEKPFGVDFASFVGASGKSFVEFYLQIGYDRLTFVRAGKFFRALYDVDFYIEDEHGNLLQTQSESDEMIATNYDETTRPDKSRLTLLSADLNPGNYQWRAVITDRESAQSYTATSKFFVRDFSGPELSVSDLQFGRNIQLDSSRNVFVKNNRRVEPNVPRAYGQSIGQLWIYYEIYNLLAPRAAAGDSTFLQTTAADSLQALYIIRDENGEEVKHLWKVSRKPGTSCVQSVLLPIIDLKSGIYSLTARVFDNANGYSAESSRRFFVQWETPAFTNESFEDIIETLQHVAKTEELNRLKKLPEAERQRGLLEFWLRRDPTPGTPRNEAMEEHQRRMDFAKTHFHWPQGKGWKSPQGQTYLIYGAPDNMRRFTAAELNQFNDRLRNSEWSANFRQGPAGLSTAGHASSFYALYEIWEYLSLNRRFVFVDSRGIGTYELVNPLMLGALGLH